MSVLQEIVRNKKEELKRSKSLVPLSELKARTGDAAPARSFREAIERKQGQPIRLIAEVKKASPSEGRIREDLNMPGIISLYDKKDASAISILTEERFFEGSLDHLAGARRLTEKPLLRKDFIVDQYQVYESRVSGADALLLIAACLDSSQLSDLLGLSQELSLDCLVEIHNLKELYAALATGTDIIGINNRDLNTLKTDLRTTFDLIRDIPDGKVVVSESGIHTRKDVESLEAAGADAVLVGTTLMRAEDIGSKIDELLGKKPG